MTQRRRFVWPGLGVVVPAVVGLLMLVFGFGMWEVDRDMDEHGVRTTGVVEMVDEDGWGVVSYFAGDMQYEIEEADALGKPVGATLVVVYDPDDPSYAVVQGDSFDEDFHWLLFGGAVLALFVAASNSGLNALVLDKLFGRFEKHDDGPPRRQERSRGKHGRRRSASGVTAQAEGSGGADGVAPSKGRRSRRPARASETQPPFSVGGRRRRVEVTEQKLTIVDDSTRYEVPWGELDTVYVQTDWDGSDRKSELIFVTPDREIALDLGYGEETTRHVPLRILRARDQLLGREPQWDTATYMRRAEEEPQDEPPAYLVPIIIGLRFVFGPLVTMIGIVLILDLIIGDWLIDHVPLWDGLIGLLDWVPG